MENIKKYEKSKKSAISLLIFLVVFVVAAQLLIFVLHEYLEKEITTYEEKIKNVRSKIDIQHMIKYRVVSYQNQIRSMPLSDSIDDLSSKRLQSLLYLQEIENCIDVLKNGGAVIRNFDTEEYKEKSKVIEYQKSYTDESKYDFLGFTVRVNVLKEMLQDLFDLIIASKFYNEKVDTVEDKMEKIKNLYQNIHPILNKMIKETDRMYSDGEVELENLLKNIANHKVIYERVLFVISALNMFLTLLMGYLISRNIYKIIESRDRTLHLLEMNKEQLESIVKDRTAELSKINEALNEEIKRREDFEKALQKSNFELEQRVKERTLHLEEEVLNRQIAEIELRKFRLVVEQSPTSIVITDSNGIIEYVNPAFEKISGYSISEVIGKKPSMLNSGKNPREKYDNMWKTISGGNPWRGEFINRSKSGELYIEHVVIAPIKNSDGLITNYIGIKEDITDLIKTREAAEKANRAKSDFLANISHEIRTPMNGVIGFIDLLKSTDLNERQRNFVDTISRSSHHLLSIINDILDYSKIESGKITLDLEYEEIRPKIESIIELFSAKGMEKGIEILYYYDLSIPAKIKCDILRINQVLSNLIGNAIKFTPEGGKIFVKILKKDINQDIVRLHFSVRDTGIGIPKEKQSQIFEAFSQAESSTTKKYGGTGLGLTIARQLVAAMGGEIVLESEEGKGSEFSFELNFSYIMEETKTDPLFYDLKAIIVTPFKEDKDDTALLIKEYLKNFSVDSTIAHLDELNNLSNNSDIYIFHYKRFADDKIKMLSRSYTPSIIILNSVEEKNFSFGENDPFTFFIFKPLNPSKLLDVLNNIFSKKITGTTIDKSFSDNCNFSGKRILVAEDNPVNQELIEIILKEMGFEVDIADNGLVALDKIKKSSDRYDIIMLDINMPEMDGFAVLDKLKEMEDLYKKTPIIAVTAHAGKSDVDKILERGFNAYIPKPFTLNTLEETLKRFLSVDHINKKGSSIPKDEKCGFNDLSKEINLDLNIYMKLLKKYISTTESQIGKLKEAIAKGSREELRMIAHSIKGSSLNLNLKRLSEISSHIEKNIDVITMDQIDRSLKEFEECFNKLKKDIGGDSL